MSTTRKPSGPSRSDPEAAGAVPPKAEVERLRETVAEQQRQLDFLYKVGHRLGTILDFQEVMLRTVELARRTVLASTGSLMVLDAQGQVQDVIHTVRGRPARVTAEVVRQVLERGLASWVYRHRRGTIVVDTRGDRRWIELPQSVRNVRSVVCVPLLYQEHLRGILTLTHPKPGHFQPYHLDLLTAAAPQIAIAIENARLYRSATQARAHLEALLANLSDALFVVDGAGRVTLVNPALERLAGRPAGEMVGRPFREAIPLDYGPPPCAIDQVLRGTSSACEEDVWLRSLAGEEVPVRLGCGALPGDGEQPGGAIIVLRDIRYLKEVERIREDLTQMLIHDLKGPLASISSTIQLLRQYPAERIGKEVIGELLESAEQNSWRLARMVETMLDVQRLESGQWALESRPIQVGETVDDVLALVAPLAREGEVEMRTDLPADLPPLRADGEFLRRVLWNLLDNALKYSPQGGLVQVKGWVLSWPGPAVGVRLPRDLAAGQWVLLSVTDDGPGVVREDQERIFEKFAQARIAPARRRGIGLGLAFCRLAVEAMGGRIWVESDLGRGSTFFFVLPVAEPGRREEVPHAV